MEHFLLNKSFLISEPPFKVDQEWVKTLPDISANLDVFVDKIRVDYYKTGRTPDQNKALFGIRPQDKYKIEGTIKNNDLKKNVIVSLFTFDYNYMRTVTTDSNGFYFFDYLPYGTYVVIAEDNSLKYNHTIQVGVKPVETV